MKRVLPTVLPKLTLAQAFGAQAQAGDNDPVPSSS
jgi:hypothetical protein